MGDELSSKRLKRWGLAGTFVAFGGVLIWSGADLLVGRTISRFSPQIEKTLSNSLGHPLKIGAYRGLRPWGIALGRTKLLPGEKDSSSVNIATGCQFNKLAIGANLTVKVEILTDEESFSPGSNFVRPRETPHGLSPL